MRATLRPFVLSLVLLLALLAPGLRSASAQQDDAALLANALAARADLAPLAGPLIGNLVQQGDFSTIEAAGVDAADFSASVVVINPDDGSNAAWDFGFEFHRDAETSQRVIVDSTRTWYYTPFPEGTPASGPAPMLDARPGARNTLDLAVEGQVALLGINGEFAASIALPPGVSSDIMVGTGFFTSTTVAGRTVSYDDFTIWPAASPAQTVDAAAVPEDDAAAFTYLLGVQANVPPLAGPYNANLVEVPGNIAASWANVRVTDFHAHAAFTMPEPAGETAANAGFLFLNSPSGTLRLAFDSAGNWYTSTGSGGPSQSGSVAGLDTASGAINTLDLFVSQGRAVFGVNGAFTAIFDLPTDAAAGDIAVGAGFYSDQQVEGRVTGFSEFTVRPFDAAAVAEPVETTSPDADQAEFLQYLSGTQSVATAAGPFTGRLVESSADSVALAAAGIALADFGTVATVTNPDDLSTSGWDTGFQFRADGDQTHRVVLRSDGEILSVQPDGTVTRLATATGYDDRPGATNTLQLFVNGNRALFGVNGELAAVIPLPGPAVASDIQVGAGFFAEDFVQGRVTGYEGFSLWAME